MEENLSVGVKVEEISVKKSLSIVSNILSANTNELENTTVASQNNATGSLHTTVENVEDIEVHFSATSQDKIYVSVNAEQVEMESVVLESKNDIDTCHNFISSESEEITSIHLRMSRDRPYQPILKS